MIFLEKPKQSLPTFVWV